MKCHPYGFILACALPLLAAQCSGGQVPDTPRVNDRYVRQGHCARGEDAEMAREKRKRVDGLQALARSCTGVQLVFGDFIGSVIKDRVIPLSPAEKVELLSLILKMEPVNGYHDGLDAIPEFIVEVLFTMPDGSVQRVFCPDVTARSRVRIGGYSPMCWCTLPDADAARWRALVKYDWILEQLRKARKR